jgi:hypothetical protein
MGGGGGGQEPVDISVLSIPLILMDYLHWRRLLAKLSATATGDSHTDLTVLALATLGGAT